MKRRTMMVALFLVMTMSMAGMEGCVHHQTSSKATEKTPNQILWQIRDHIKQLAKDVRDARQANLITEDRYQELQRKVSEASDYYNKLRAHYALWKELNGDYQNKVTVLLLYVANIITPLKGGE